MGLIWHIQQAQDLAETDTSPAIGFLRVAGAPYSFRSNARSRNAAFQLEEIDAEGGP